jgi:nicotinamidase-related amidase
MKNQALILVDFQNEWTDPNSEYCIGNDLKEFISKTNQLIKYARENSFKIIFVRHEEEGYGKIFTPGSKNVELLPNLDFQPTDTIIVKNRISAFYKTNLESELQGIKEIYISGILTNLCVRSLIHDAYDRDFGITVITDCCTTYDSQTHEFTLKDLQNTRPEIHFIKLENISS